jgi:hypothetical protein
MVAGGGWVDSVETEEKEFRVRHGREFQSGMVHRRSVPGAQGVLADGKLASDEL